MICLLRDHFLMKVERNNVMLEKLYIKGSKTRGQQRHYSRHGLCGANKAISSCNEGISLRNTLVISSLIWRQTLFNGPNCHEYWGREIYTCFLHCHLPELCSKVRSHRPSHGGEKEESFGNGFCLDSSDLPGLLYQSSVRVWQSLWHRSSQKTFS